MHLITRTVVGVCAAVAVLTPTATVAGAAPVAESAAHAQAPAKRFATARTLEKAQLQVCKVQTKNKKGWKVYGRLNASKVKMKGGQFSGALLVKKAGVDEPTATWQSAMTKRGKISKVGAVVVPKKGGFSLEGGIGTGSYGDGGPIRLAKVKKC